MMKEISPIQSESGKKEYVAIIGFVCNACNAEMMIDEGASPQVRILM